tara:strand:- start:31281 stop:31562 length:282 start_codon:yes stop_codon:yes gene_type:complete
MNSETKAALELNEQLRSAECDASWESLAAAVGILADALAESQAEVERLRSELEKFDGVPMTWCAKCNLPAKEDCDNAAHPFVTKIYKESEGDR